MTTEERLEKLEKDVGKEKLIQRLKDEGYGFLGSMSERGLNWGPTSIHR